MTDLRRSLGTWGGAALLVGTMIGGGIFRTPGPIAENLSDARLILLLWLFVGIISMCGALTLAELATMLPQTGGTYVYLRAAYGDGAAFVFGWLYLLVAILLFFLPRAWGSYWNYIIGTVGIYVILGLGLNMIVGYAGQLVLGYVAFFAIGAYSIGLLAAPKPHNLMWNFWVVLLIGIILAAFTGLLLGLPILRLRGDYLAIVTLGFGEIIRILLQSDLMSPYTGGPRGIPNIAGPTLLGKPFNSDIDFMYLIFLAVALCIFITTRLQNSRTGRAWVAIREDEVAARATGINTFQSKLLSLAIGAAFAGIGGVLFASRNQFTGPEDHSLMVSINVLALVIVGGMASIPGVILGSAALKGLPEILRELDIYRLMFFGALLVVMMILRPEGLWPAKRPKLEGEPQKTPTPQQQAQAAKVEGD